jgi:facilitated trehalose transporter
MGEILPSKVRGLAASIATAFNWLCVFAVTKTFIDIIGEISGDHFFDLLLVNFLLLLLELIGNHGAFWLFGGICIVGIFFSIKYVPETRGKSLDEIQNQMLSKKDRLGGNLI